MEDKTPSSQLVEAVASAAAAWRKQLEQIAFDARAIFNDTSDQVHAHIKQISVPQFELPSLGLDTFLRDFGDTTRQLNEWIESMPAQAKHDLPILAARGWYLDQDMAVRAPAEMAKEIQAGDSQAVDDFLIDHFRTREEGIRKDLLEKYPNRKRFLSAAFDAHARGEFALSIPVFLAQADGICKDRTAKLLFQKEDKRPQIAHYIESAVTDAYEAALLSPLTQNHAISLSERERPADFSGLNRHQVLHGESLDYDTEVNSLKAISLLNYLVLTFKDRETSALAEINDAGANDAT